MSRSLVAVLAAALALQGRGETLPDVLAPDLARVAEIAARLPEKPGLTVLPDTPEAKKAQEVLASPIPDCSDELYLLTSRTGDRMTYQDVYFKRLFCRTLLPEKAVQEKIGGLGKEFWSNGRNWEVNPRYLADSEKACATQPGLGPWFGKWRLSVRPPQPAAEDRFLHVINVSGEKGAQACPCRLEREGNRDVAVFRIAGVTVKGRTGALEVRAAFNRTGSIGGEITYGLLDEGVEPVFSGRRPLTGIIQPQSGVFSRMS